MPLQQGVTTPRGAPLADPNGSRTNIRGGTHQRSHSAASAVGRATRSSSVGGGASPGGVPSHHPAVKAAAWSSTAYIAEATTTDAPVTRSTSCATADAPHPSSVSALLLQELTSIDSFMFGVDAVGSVRLDYATRPIAAASPLPVPSPTPHSSTPSAPRYLSPYGLRDPVCLRIDRSKVTVSHVAAASTCPTDAAATAAVIITIPFTSMARVELRRDGSLLLRRVDGQEVSLSMHSAPKAVAAYKILTVRCRGAFPKNSEDATFTIERRLAMEREREGSSQEVHSAEDPTSAAQVSVAPASSTTVPTPTTTAHPSEPVQRRAPSNSPSLHRSNTPSGGGPLAQQPPHRRSPQVSSVHPCALRQMDDILPVQLPAARTVPNRTAKTPIPATIEKMESERNFTVVQPDHAGGEAPHQQVVRVVHNMASSPSLASREERRQQLRLQLLSLRKERASAVLPL